MIKPLPENPNREVLLQYMRIMLDHINALSIRAWAEAQGLQQLTYLSAQLPAEESDAPPVDAAEE